MKVDECKTYADRMRLAMKLKDWRPVDLERAAKKIDPSIKQQNISYACRKDAKGSRKNKLWADVLGITEHWLATGSGDVFHGGMNGGLHFDPQNFPAHTFAPILDDQLKAWLDEKQIAKVDKVAVSQFCGERPVAMTMLGDSMTSSGPVSIVSGATMIFQTDIEIQHSQEFHNKLVGVLTPKGFLCRRLSVEPEGYRLKALDSDFEVIQFKTDNSKYCFVGLLKQILTPVD